MQVALVILAAVLVILLFPIAVFACKRISLCVRLKSVCGRKGYALIPTHFFWFFGNFNGGRCDCYVRTPDGVYSVKLCGASSKTFIDFADDVRYGRRSIRFHISPELPVMREKGKKKFDFQYRCPETHGVKITPVIFMYPMPLKVTYRKNGIGNGDFIGEGYFYDRTGFMNLLVDESTDCRERTEQAKII
ncbi:MAG: hypothetical protein J1E00_06555 [Oscillospiraceae bacterium]|nr:hypothetical protein [Oscillospiraceae bacterium]